MSESPIRSRKGTENQFNLPKNQIDQSITSVAQPGSMIPNQKKERRIRLRSTSFWDLRRGGVA